MIFTNKLKFSFRPAAAVFFSLAALAIFNIQGQSPQMSVSPQAIRIPAGMAVLTREVQPLPGRVRIGNLKAVLIGAPIDGDRGSWTLSEIANLRKAAAVLRANNVNVREFYTPQNDWAAIKEASRGAQFLLYRGHGVYDGSQPPRKVGGFALKSGFFSGDQIKSDLQLAPGAIIMLYGCFTAGNSGFDMGLIDEREAKRRVAMYSLPFMEMRASGYYANWFGDAFASFLSSLFDGKTLGESYKSYNDFNAQSVSYDVHPQASGKKMWVDHDNWDHKIVYNNAFVGEPEKNLLQLFGGQTPQPIPEPVPTPNPQPGPQPNPNPSPQNDPVSSGDCISAGESRLLSLIMDYRRSRGLRAVPVSRSLSRVARMHARDLSENPPRGECNMHSWSSSTKWSACCYTPNHARSQCMWNKPRELSRYPGNGYEISYGGSMHADPEGALHGWQGSTGHNSVIINAGIWSSHPWGAIGAGIVGGYAVVWFGEETDPEGPAQACR